MEQFKINNFERENEVAFPKFRTLKGSEVDNITSSLKSMLKLPQNLSNELLVAEISAKSILIKTANLQDDSPTFSIVMRDLGLNIPEKLYLNWGRFQEIDEVRSEDLIKYFDDIWYPSSDDLDIVDSNFQWVVSIDHDGMVNCLQFLNT